MSEFESQSVERVRFDVGPDGTLEGDDGAAGHLAGMLRYVCRMGSQIGALLELGDLERLSTLSSVAVLARVAGTPPEQSIKAEVQYVAASVPRPDAAAGVGLTVQQLIERVLRSATLDLTCDWVALVSDDSRLVGAMHDESVPEGVPASVLEVGVRALAVMAALDEAMRESAVRFDFPRASVLVVPVGEHALFMCADKFESSEVLRSVALVHAHLDRVDLRAAAHVTSSVRA